MAIVIRMNVPLDGPSHYFILDQGVVTAHNFGGYQEWGVDSNNVIESYKELVYFDWSVVPHSLINLSKLTKGKSTSDPGAVHDFNIAWQYVCLANKEDKMAEKFIPYKALMLFNLDEQTNSYDKDVFLWDSVNGVQRMSFMTYLERVQEKHDGAYKLVKLNIARATNLAVADFKFLQAAKLSAVGRSEKVYMVFRSLWYCATGEEMPL